MFTSYANLSCYLMPYNEFRHLLCAVYHFAEPTYSPDPKFSFVSTEYPLLQRSLHSSLSGVRASVPSLDTGGITRLGRFAIAGNRAYFLVGRRTGVRHRSGLTVSEEAGYRYPTPQ